MQRQKILFIYNPQAGRAKIKNLLSDIIELFNQHYEVIVYATQGRKDAEKIVKESLKSQDYEYVVCSGGDGTLNEVVNGIMVCENKPKLGFIPSGTTNDYAYSLKVPKNMLKAAQLVLDENLFSCDVGSFNERYFLYNASFGLFTETAYQTPQSFKNILGRLAYIIEGIKSLSNIKSYHIDIETENQIISDDYIFGMIANSYSVGGFRGITGKNVLLNDGEFEGIFIKRPSNLLDLQLIISDIRKGVLNSEFILSFSVKDLKIKSEEPIAWCTDGEFAGELQMVNIKNNKEAITIATILGTK